MRKRTRYKSPVLDFFVVTVCLSVAGYFAWTFWKDLNSTARRTDKQEIATITFKNRIAQRKFDDRVVWERIDKSTPLYNGDLVRTADLAEAVITFNDGSQVDIYENTMIQVYYSDYEGVQISVGNGNLQLESSDTGKVELKLSDGSKVNAGGGASIAAKTSASSSGPASGNKTVEVKSGSATVTASSGATEAVAAGQSVSVKESGEISKKPVTVTSIPAELKVLNIEGKESGPVKLEWNKSSTNEPVVLQTSYKKDYSVIAEEKVLTTENDSLISLSEGTVYWRIFPENKPEEASEGKISVDSTKPLSLITPANEAVLQYRNRSPEVNFRWNGNKYANNYMLKVSSSPDMQNPIVSKIVENQYTTIDNLGNGDWWWQVTPYYELSSLGYADAGASAVYRFTVEKQNGINPPSLTVPLQNAEIRYKDSLNVNFSWKSDIKANYQLLVAKDSDFSDIVAIRHTAGQRESINFDLPNEDNLQYYWKVIRNSDDSEDLNPESLVRSFTVSRYVSTPAKLLYPPEEFTTESSKLPALRFMWKPSDQAINKETIVQVSSSPDFKNSQIEKTVTGTTLENLNLDSGSYYWRIGTQTQEGNIEYTEPHHITVQKELTAPVITNIKDNQEVLIAQAAAVRLSWTSVSDADYYNVKIYDKNNSLIAEKPEVAATTTSFALPDAAYTVRIQAVSSQTESSPIRTGPVESLDFSVRTPTQLTGLRPYASERIDGLNALRSPVIFSWKDGSDKTTSAELVLKKLQVDGSWRQVERLKVNQNKISLPRLSSGTYSWQILANTKEGIPIDSKPLEFTITRVDALPDPLLTAPVRNFVMDSSFLKKNRSITFEWNEVPGATEYSFVLYRKERNGNLVPVWSEKNVKGNKVRLRKLSVLDVGNFEWYVTAYTYAKDGFEERHSDTVRSSFTIKFDSPIQITPEKNGRMYSAD